MPRTMRGMRHIEIFRAGRHTDINGVERQFTDADLQGMASGYDPKLHEAPLVVGHPRTDDPAYGWVQGLKVAAGKLLAIPRQVQAAFGEAVQSGAYKKVSAAFYSPTDKHNPTPGQWYLRHVGFLGAMPPAIKGLEGAAFGEGDALENAVVIEFAESPALAADAQDTTASAAPSPAFSPTDTPQPPKEPAVTEAEAAALKAQNETLQRELDAARARETAAAQAARTAEHTAFAERLISQGKVPEADKARIVAIADAIHPVGEPVMFGEGKDTAELYAQFQQFLDGLKPMVAFGEAASRERAPGSEEAEEGEHIEYAEGADPERIELDKRIRAHAKAKGVDYRTAALAVAR
ncbi:peptidase [Vandammella animalimorsus]|uniref:Peptidase n=1 Tax=Vandammella animalimorsus TaxID=2029117 RepID=A0A3M6RU92_9BURK|nr:peptidase [Vandammella animalimorsus]RMX18867.1 peptidase [Vandammella animalimorsus]